MPRLMPPPGTVTRKQAVEALLREEAITSPSMLEKLKGIKKVILEGRTHGFYPESQILDIINSHRNSRHLPPLRSIFDEEHKIVCRQAEPSDMFGVYAVAQKLFGHTTAAEDRMPLIERVPEGNLVVTDRGKIVGYIHIQPLLPDVMQKFRGGEIRGAGIRAEDLDPFRTGKVVNILVKSVGSYHDHKSIATLYNKILFRKLEMELKLWGEKGYIIDKVYATSETPSGIDAASSFKMASLGRVRGSSGKRRYAYVLDVAQSDLRYLKPYKLALEKWRVQHQEEYEQAWRDWHERQTK